MEIEGRSTRRDTVGGTWEIVQLLATFAFSLNRRIMHRMTRATAAKTAGAQPAAFYALALETGMRTSELAGLKWSDLEVGHARLTVQRQLVKPGHEPIFGPVKNKQARLLELTAETIALLRVHRATQAEIKMRSRQQLPRSRPDVREGLERSGGTVIRSASRFR